MLLGQNADEPRQLLGVVVLEIPLQDLHHPGAVLEQPGQGLEHRGFAGTVWADDGGDFALPDMDIQV